MIVLTPLIMMFFSALSRRGREISTPKKIAIGMGLAGLAYLFLCLYSLYMGYPSGDVFRAEAADVKAAMKAGPWVLIALYFFLTVAELFISPLGLSFVSKVAPKHLQGLCQGLSARRNRSRQPPAMDRPADVQQMAYRQAWGVFLAVCLVSMVVMFGMVSWLERVTTDAPPLSPRLTLSNQTKKT